MGKQLMVAFAAALCVLGCVYRSNRLTVSSLCSQKLDKEMEFSVLKAPPAHDVDPAELPVILFLHGMGSDHRTLDQYGVSEQIYNAMATGKIPRAHLILPDGERGFYLNWYDGTRPYEDYILQEVLPAAEKLLGVKPDPSRRHIAGVSMGGTGALQMGLGHPELFASVTCLSGLIMNKEQAAQLMDSFLMSIFVPVKRIWGYGCDDTFGDRLNAYVLVENRPPGTSQRIFIAFGDQESDEMRNTAIDFHAFLDSKGIEHEYVIYEGGHGWRYWVPVIEQAITYAVKPSR